jgi:hypothetical protein
MNLLFGQIYTVLNNRLNEGAHNGSVPLETSPTVKGWEAAASVWGDKPWPSGWFPAAAH